MPERFRLEVGGYSRERVGVRVIGSCRDFHGISGSLKLTGDLAPEDALLFAEALRAKAEQVIAANAKRAADEERRRERLSKMPQISWR